MENNINTQVVEVLLLPHQTLIGKYMTNHAIPMIGDHVRITEDSYTGQCIVKYRQFQFQGAMQVVALIVEPI